MQIIDLLNSIFNTSLQVLSCFEHPVAQFKLAIGKGLKNTPLVVAKAKSLRLILFLSCTSLSALLAQSEIQGINYQAVVRDAIGKIAPNTQLSVKIALVSEKKDLAPFYQETHQITTDFLGQFDVLIGQGKEKQGTFATIPWGKEQIWLDVQIQGNQQNKFEIQSRSRLLSVPYALHALSTAAIQNDQAIEKNQSIYWTTSGNSATRPPTHFMGSRDSNDVVIKTDSQTLLTLKAFGQTHLQGRVLGNDSSPNNYPMTIEGGSQGIYIRVRGSRSNANNFVTFADDFGVWGRIEGQTQAELKGTWQYKLKELLSDLRYFSLLSFGVSKAAEAKGLTAAGFTAAAGVIAFGIAALLGEELDQTKGEFDTFSGIEGTKGVSYASGAGDYAEWLKRKPGERKLLIGEVIGIKEGLVSLNTDSADHIKVISTRPVVLGNAPQEQDKHLYEKVALMGQVPVKVAGPVSIGDFVIPSGNNDGFGVAIHPNEMRAGDYARSIGVAWQNAPDQPFNLVNTAVGINTNDLSHKVENLNRRLENIIAFLAGNTSSLEQPSSTPPSAHSTFGKLLSDDEFDKFVDQNEPAFKELYLAVKSEMQNNGINLSLHPKLLEFMDNPAPTIKQLRRNPRFVTQWALADQQIKNAASTK